VLLIVMAPVLLLPIVLNEVFPVPKLTTSPPVPVVLRLGEKLLVSIVPLPPMVTVPAALFAQVCAAPTTSVVGLIVNDDGEDDAIPPDPIESCVPVRLNAVPPPTIAVVPKLIPLIELPLTTGFFPE
jgi:hypothetical protein